MDREKLAGDRYSRHRRIPEIGVTGQEKISGASVLVVGSGGLGSPALLYLAAAGVGNIGIVDFDVVDLTNLQRQVIFTESDIGQHKATEAARKVLALNSTVRVQVHNELLTSANARTIIGGYDIVIDATDNFATRYLINDACILEGIPCVWASILRFDGQISVFGLDKGPCYRCVFPEPPTPGSIPSCSDAGVLGAMCGVIGSMQAVEALKPFKAAIRVDANGGWSVEDALEMMPWLAERGCEYVEQPLARGEEDQLPELFRKRPLLVVGPWSNLGKDKACDRRYPLLPPLGSSPIFGTHFIFFLNCFPRYQRNTQNHIFAAEDRNLERKLDRKLGRHI